MIKLQETTRYRVDNENEATELIEQAKQEAIQSGYEIKKSSYTAKCKKKKGEIVDSWFVVEICRKYADEQLPDKE